jgi:hypothetical protein
MFIDGTMSVFAIIATNYLDVQLGMTASQRTSVIGLLLVTAFICRWSDA